MKERRIGRKGKGKGKNEGIRNGEGGEGVKKWENGRVRKEINLVATFIHLCIYELINEL